MKEMQTTSNEWFDVRQFVPDLRAVFEQKPNDPAKIIKVGVAVKEPGETTVLTPAGEDRSLFALFSGEEVWQWKTESLRLLFRGDKQPLDLGDHPAAYNDSFFLLDWHALEISEAFGDRRDVEMKEIYSTLRRRPDGKSLGFVHDYMWQAAALVLATRPLSQAEFEAIMARLERSCRTFAMGSTSKNYIATLKRTIGQQS